MDNNPVCGMHESRERTYSQKTSMDVNIDQARYGKIAVVSNLRTGKDVFSGQVEVNEK
jgi:hypothetical protein